ncbi:hypothetical protein AG0111_0g2599 [Alternaria gaisen]|uniref:Uncharacterized protein n=1 Tax=Alternaria gaisen TaxID=167740 RepID=A0ACB6FXR4_9PLEO|nr:hypothetical protein AG0111_0g2599 [Alternaria gaisen]
MRLTYVNNDRGPHPMDKTILSSSHLDNLDFTALAYGPEAICPSEMSELKQCLLQARNLKTLRLQVGALSGHMNDDYQESPLNLPFREGDMFPALEELTLDPKHQNYFPTAEHCQMWSRCMDWSQLHTLDFGEGTPTALLQALTGRVSQLKTFNFGFREGYTGAARACWNSNKDMKVLERFLNSIDALRNVKTCCEDDVHVQMVRPKLLAKHGQSLRSLEAKYWRDVAWEPEHFYNLAETARGVKILRLPMRVQRKEGTKGLSVWPDDQATRNTSAVARLRKLFTISSSQRHGVSSLKSSTLSSSPWTPPSAAAHRSIHSALTSFRHLTQLHLRLYLQLDSDHLISYPHPDAWGSPQIKEKVAHKLMLRLWHDFGPKSAIQQIEVDFLAPGGSTKIWHYTVSRKWQKRISDGIWKDKVVVEMWQEGKDYDPSTFDPFC